MDKLFSLRTEIEGKMVTVEVFPNSDLLEVSREVCKRQGLQPPHERTIVQLITDELRNNLENQDEDLEWKYELSCVLERFLDMCEEANIAAPAPTQYFKSQAKRSKGRQPILKQQDRPIGLYDRALKLQEKRQLIHEQGKQEQQNKELQSCTFQPRINSTSTNSFRKRRLQQQNVYDVLYQQAKSIEGKKDKRRMELIQEQKIPTFTPELNQCSLRIVEVKGKEEIAKRATPKNTLQPVQYPFKPTISEESKRLAKQFPTFWEKLEREACSHEHRPECTTKRQTTGQENRDPQLNPRSIEILETKKLNLFSFIFEQLQSDGYVDEQSIHHNKCLMQAEQFQVVLPLLEEISSLKVQLNKEEFIESLQVLYATLHSHDKSRLIGHNIRTKWQDEHDSYRNQFTFRPKISVHPHKDKTKQATFQSTVDRMFYTGCEVIEEDEAETSQSSCRADTSTIDS